MGSAEVPWWAGGGHHGWGGARPHILVGSRPVRTQSATNHRGEFKAAPSTPRRHRLSRQHRHRGWNFDKGQGADQEKEMEVQAEDPEGVPGPGVVEKVSVRMALKTVPRGNN